jgi:hypothetical protein
MGTPHQNVMLAWFKPEILLASFPAVLAVILIVGKSEPVDSEERERCGTESAPGGEIGLFPFEIRASFDALALAVAECESGVRES